MIIGRERVKMTAGVLTLTLQASRAGVSLSLPFHACHAGYLEGQGLDSSLGFFPFTNLGML